MMRQMALTGSCWVTPSRSSGAVLQVGCPDAGEMDRNHINCTGKGWCLLQKQNYPMEQGSLGSYQLGSTCAKLVTQVQHQPVVGNDQQSVVSGRGEELFWRGAGWLKKIILPLYLTIIRPQQKDQAHLEDLAKRHHQAEKAATGYKGWLLKYCPGMQGWFRKVKAQLKLKLVKDIKSTMNF